MRNRKSSLWKQEQYNIAGVKPWLSQSVRRIEKKKTRKARNLGDDNPSKSSCHNPSTVKSLLFRPSCFCPLFCPGSFQKKGKGEGREQSRALHICDFVLEDFNVPKSL